MSADPTSPDTPAVVPVTRWSWWNEASGAVADLGVLVPIAVALVVANHLSATAVLLPAALGYLLVAAVYRVPVAVQPLKAFGAIAIAAGAGADVIAAGALLLGAAFLVLGSTGLLDRAARLFPTALIRGIQLTVGLTFVKIAWGLIAQPPPAFVHQLAPAPTAVVAASLVAALLAFRQRLILPVVVVAVAAAAALVLPRHGLQLGPSPISLPHLSTDDLLTAATLLVIPQLPLTFANSCLAPADAARTYFGSEGERVRPGRLALTLGSLGLVAGGVCGMPVCHGAGGMSAHASFGARTWRAPLLIGGSLLALALGLGATAGAVLTAFPLSVLAALLLVAAWAHIQLMRDLATGRELALAIGVGVIGITWNLAWALALGLLVVGAQRVRR